MMKAVVAITTAILLSSTIAVAQRAPAGACAADIKAQCAGIQPGAGRIRACLKEHLADLSQPCQERLARLAAIHKACAADVKQTCAGVKPGRGRIAACLKGALANLSEPCKEAFLQGASGGK